MVLKSNQRNEWLTAIAGGMVLVAALLGGMGVHPPSALAQESNGNRRLDLEQQLERLETEAQELDRTLQQVQGETRSLDNEVTALNTQIKRRQLEINRLALVLRRAALEIQQKEERIQILTAKISKQSEALSASLFLLYLYDQENTLTTLLKNRSLSGFLTTLGNLGRVQSHIQQSLDESREDRELLGQEKAELEEFREEQQELKALQEVERRFLAQKKAEKDEILRLTKGKETLFQQLLKSKKRDIATLKTQLFYLEKTGITAEEAVRFADLAARRAGIRTAFLLALLEVETGKQFEDGVISVGTNLGTGHWERDLYQCYQRLGKRSVAEAEKAAFFRITSELGLDPDRMPVSRKPSYGCGGAMGPAQFLPTTWLRFADRVRELTGHTPPNPWNVEDAFTAAAVFLAEAGATAQTTDGEIRAAKTYISGRPNCTKYVCRSYANRILALSRDIDRIL